MPTDSNRKAVYTIIDREGGKARWVKIGICFTNRDGSMNLVLDALPLNGKLHIREETPKGRESDRDDMP